jgi:hypothetical protein
MEITINDIASAFCILLFSISFVGVKEVLLRPDQRTLKISALIMIPQLLVAKFFQSKFSNKIYNILIGFFIFFSCLLIISYLENDITWVILLSSYIFLQGSKIKNRTNSCNFITARLSLTFIFITLTTIITFNVDYITALSFFMGLFLYVNKSRPNIMQNIVAILIESLFLYKILYVLMQSNSLNSMIEFFNIDVILLFITFIFYFFVTVYKRNFLKLNYKERSIILSLLVIMNVIYINVI